MIDRLIFHITHVDNLRGIMSEGRLWSDAQRVWRGFANTNIGYSHIKARRMRHPVTVARRGTLGQYVPFNFCPRSIMLCAVHCGHEGYDDGQSSVVHLVSSVETITSSGRPWFFTDRHADLRYTRQFDSLDKLSEVDWSVMPIKFWGGDEELKEKRQAEFLVYDWCPVNAIRSIGVINKGMIEKVSNAIAQSRHKPVVEVHRDWYY